MKHLPHALFTISLTTIVGCSSTPAPTPVPLNVEQEKLLTHMSQGKRSLGSEFDSKFNKDGIMNGEYVAIASIKGPISENDKQLLTMVAADAKATLLETAPQQFKRIVQSALSTTVGGNGTVDSSSISINEVRALTGVTVNFSDTQCVKYALPNENLGYDYIKECRAIARVPAANLSRAFKYTLDKKYADLETSNSVKDVLLKELQKDE